MSQQKLARNIIYTQTFIILFLLLLLVILVGTAVKNEERCFYELMDCNKTLNLLTQVTPTETDSAPVLYSLPVLDPSNLDAHTP